MKKRADGEFKKRFFTVLQGERFNNSESNKFYTGITELQLPRAQVGVGGLTSSPYQNKSDKTIAFPEMGTRKGSLRENIYAERKIENSLEGLQKSPLIHVNNAMCKRIFDILFSILIITLLLSWLTPILAILIKINSRGPVFFYQIRTGLNNKNFKCYKFRSMILNKEADQLPAIKNDQRITWIGKIMRSRSLDELPQFFNVLLGHMSVVGPRPHMLIHTKIYSHTFKSFRYRAIIKPGITGWAQVNHHRGEIKQLIDIQKRINDDFWYIRNWRLFLDIKIITLTIWQILLGDDKAY